MRHPLGISIVGGLLVSQALTLYTTPVIFLYLDRFGNWLGRLWSRFYLRADARAIWRESGHEARRGAFRRGAGRSSLLALAAARRRARLSPPRRDRSRAITRNSRAGSSRTPRDDFAKGDVVAKSSAIRDSTRSKRRSPISNQTLKADEANYREALALIAEARAGLFPDRQLQSVAHALERRLDSCRPPRRRGERHVDARPLGQSAPHDRRAGRRGRRPAPPTSPTRRSRAIGARARLFPSCARPTRSHDLLADTVNQYTALARHHAEPIHRGHRRKSDVITAQALVLAAQAQEINTGVARAQNEHAIAVLMGRPPAGLSIPHGKLADDVPQCAGAAALDAARASPGHRRGRADDAGAERGDRRRDRRLLSRHHAERRLRLFGRSVHQSARRPPIRSGPTACRSRRRCSTAA